MSQDGRLYDRKIVSATVRDGVEGTYHRPAHRLSLGQSSERNVSPVAYCCYRLTLERMIRLPAVSANGDRCSRPTASRADKSNFRGSFMLKAILRDVQLWIPVCVLVAGIFLLIALH